MTLSQSCFNVYSQLKAIIPNISRSQVYELLSAQLGYRAYKHLCQDAIVLFGLGYQDFENNDLKLLNQRIKDLNLNISIEQFNQISTLIGNELKQHKIYAPKVKDFTQKLLQSINYRQGFDVLDENKFYQDLNQMCFSDKPSLEAMILHLFLLSRIEPEWNEEQRAKKRTQEVIQKSIDVFGEKTVLPYLIIFHLVEDDNIDFIKAFYDKHGLREVIEDCVSNHEFLEAHAWYNLALKFGYSNILTGKESHTYAVPTTYENGDFYDSDDGEWYYIADEEGYKPITLPILDNSLLGQVKKLTDDFFQLYKDTQKAIEYARNSFVFQGFQNSEIGYYWRDEYDDFDDEYDDF